MSTPVSQPKKSADEIALAYKSEPWWYDVRGFFILTFAYNSTLTRQLRFFGPHFGARHLEIACGTGTLLGMIFAWRRWKKLPTISVVGIDYAESMLAGARHRFKNVPGLELKLADVADMPFADASFDTANIANAVHCFPDVGGAWRDTLRVLKPGGTVAANVLLFPRGSWPFSVIADAINRWGIRKGILVTPYDQAEIRASVVAAGFEIVSESVSGNCYDLMARKPSPAP